MPGAPVAKGLGRLLNLRAWSVLRIRAETDITAGYAEPVGFKLVIRILDEKFLAATDRALHSLVPL